MFKARFRIVMFVLGALVGMFTADCEAAEQLGLNADVAQFQDINGQSYIEIYYSLPQSRLQYSADTDGGFGCRLILDLEIYMNDRLWSNKAWKIEEVVADTAGIDVSSQLVDAVRYFIDEAGTYTVKIRARDMHEQGGLDSVEVAFEALGFSTDAVDVSSIELASKIERVSGGDKGNLIKNSYRVLPIPANVFGQDANRIFYYFEAYNLMQHVPGGRYVSMINVRDAGGRLVEGMGVERTRKKVHDMSLELGMFDVSALPSGRYSLSYGIADSSKTLLSERQKKFFVYNPAVAITAPEREAGLGPLENLSEKELDSEFKYLKYLASKEDISIYKGLNNAAAKRKYLRLMWNTPRDEYAISGWPFRAEYLARVRFAEKNYRSVFDAGWRSDRGRVFVLYGPPSDIERFPSSQETVPYQTWTYEHLRGQANVLFVFADKRNSNKYLLIHSTLRGELQDFSWQRTISRGSNENVFR